PTRASRRDALILGIGAALSAVGLAGGFWGRSHVGAEVRPQVLDPQSTALAALDASGTLAAIARADGRVTLASTEKPDRISSIASAGSALALGFIGPNVVLVTSDGIYDWCPGCADGSGKLVSSPSRNRIVGAKVSSGGNTVAYLVPDGPTSFSLSAR